MIKKRANLCGRAFSSILSTVYAKLTCAYPHELFRVRTCPVARPSIFAKDTPARFQRVHLSLDSLHILSRPQLVVKGSPRIGRAMVRGLLLLTTSSLRLVPVIISSRRCSLMFARPTLSLSLAAASLHYQRRRVRELCKVTSLHCPVDCGMLQHTTTPCPVVYVGLKDDATRAINSKHRTKQCCTVSTRSVCTLLSYARCGKGQKQKTTITRSNSIKQRK